MKTTPDLEIVKAALEMYCCLPFDAFCEDRQLKAKNAFRKAVEKAFNQPFAVTAYEIDK